MAENQTTDKTAQFDHLFEDARIGSTNERAALIESFRSYLKTLAVETMGHQRVGQLSASDVVQSAIIDANNGFEACRATTYKEFKGWLKQILLNDVVNRYRYLRSQKRDIRLEQPIGDHITAIDGAQSPSREAILAEDKERLKRALSRLSDDQRQVITLRQRDQMTFVAIAKEMGRSHDATRKLWSRSVAALADVLREHD